MSIYDKIRHYIDDSGTPDPDPDMIVRSVLADYPTRKQLAAATYPVIHDAVVRVLRDHVRALERVTPIQGKCRSDGRDPVADRMNFLASTFFTGTHRVAWGEATIADHLERIDYQEKKRSGIAMSVLKHRNAIAAIQENNVTCLNEIKVAS